MANTGIRKASSVLDLPEFNVLLFAFRNRPVITSFPA
ncbi:hypothetical protein J2T57_004179 [Natronocella acetinitrilica]|uniref:Uncharacterized protein n=1 Tax=Natronocella acetinitrilica TaxID=414046 RepID=A0AAE3G6Y3_9GAMM|nr:hypothetical protein [Natronocella acetinitrilica]